MKRTISFVLILSLGLTAEVANADFTFGESMNLGPVINSGAVEFNPRLTGDGLEFYFMSQPALGMQGDIWYTTRAATSDPWRGRQPASLPTDETEDYAAPDITEDGLTLYVSSWRRLDRYGAGDIYVATRSMRSEPWSEPTNLGPVVNTSYSESCSFLSADGLSLYFCGDPWTTASPQQQRPGGNGMSDIWIANRATQEDQWGACTESWTRCQQFQYRCCAMHNNRRFATIFSFQQARWVRRDRPMDGKKTYERFRMGNSDEPWANC